MAALRPSRCRLQLLVQIPRATLEHGQQKMGGMYTRKIGELRQTLRRLENVSGKRRQSSSNERPGLIPISFDRYREQTIATAAQSRQAGEPGGLFLRLKIRPQRVDNNHLNATIAGPGGVAVF